MFESTYDIIEWKSCASSTSTSLTNQIDSNRQHSNSRVYPFSREDGGSSADIVFPALFHERGTETSIVSLPELDDFECDPLLEDTVYQKVANWVMMQKKYFRNVEVPIEDDEMEVIDPVDLFHESVLDDYQLITGKFFVIGSHQEVFSKDDVLKNFAKFIGKHLCRRPFLNKFPGLQFASLLKRTLDTGVFSGTLRIFIEYL